MFLEAIQLLRGQDEGRGRLSKMFDFVHTQGIKTVHVGGGQAVADFCPRSCRMLSYSNAFYKQCGNVTNLRAIACKLKGLGSCQRKTCPSADTERSTSMALAPCCKAEPE